ncbi:ribosomal-protein-alanine N-acetyltransferase [Rubricella aquisinus]|uniref:Ribosomal-protein-alanine N-acetyltransferase n=1 Tax=Rubricella aquisinus TaxID=2028108 RepID=A0A840WGE2_9RHOB|nr:GNAT family N-acetyltransferase [Rubricella aquisinus]MBB5514209.1 ribosomal-protein-alanine N-acetyltransferase [Rubricella aquisinus]
MEHLAAIHAQSFTDMPRPWSATELADVAASPGAILIEEAQGFALGRVVMDEAELLTIAVAPEARRAGRGARLLTRFELAAQEAGATRVFLEVAARNAPAQALYLSHGYAPVGARRGYYRGQGGAQDDAVVMAKSLTDAELSRN